MLPSTQWFHYEMKMQTLVRCRVGRKAILSKATDDLGIVVELDRGSKQS